MKEMNRCIIICKAIVWIYEIFNNKNKYFLLTER